MNRCTFHADRTGLRLAQPLTAFDRRPNSRPNQARSSRRPRLALQCLVLALCCLGVQDGANAQTQVIPRFFTPTEDLALELQPVMPFGFAPSDIHCLAANTRGDFFGYVKTPEGGAFIKVQDHFYNAVQIFRRDVLTTTSYATELKAPMAINDLGQVVFIATGRYTRDPNALGASSRLVLFSNGSMTDIGVPVPPDEPGGIPYFYLSGYASVRINNQGAVLIGDRFWGKSYLRHPGTGEWTTLAADTDWIATDLNDLGDIVGQFLASGKGGILSDGVLQEIPANPGTGTGINAPLFIGNDRRILWTSGHITDRAGQILQRSIPSYNSRESLRAGARITTDGVVRCLGPGGNVAIHFSGDTIDSSMSPGTMANYFPQPVGLESFANTVRPVDVIDQWRLLDGWLGPIVASPPIFVTQPTTIRVRLGSPAEFTAVVAGPLARFANGSWSTATGWMRDGAPAPGVPSSTSPALPVWTESLHFDHVAAGDAGNYILMATNVTGVVSSDVVRLEILTPPAVAADPSDVTACADSTVRFSVSASGIPAPSCQWTFQGVDIPGANDTSLTLSHIDATHEGRYAVRLSNSEGTFTSGSAELSLIHPPVITNTTTAKTIRAGETLVLEAEATGSSPLAYAWSRDQVTIPGANSAILTIPNVSTTDAGAYAVTVSNECGATTSGPIAVRILPPPPRLQRPRMLAAFEIAGNVGTTYRIEAADNEISTTWVPVATVTLTRSPQLFIDEQSDRFTARIYRAVEAP